MFAAGTGVLGDSSGYGMLGNFMLGGTIAPIRVYVTSSVESPDTLVSEACLRRLYVEQSEASDTWYRAPGRCGNTEVLNEFTGRC
jgi:hypothetical protein